jgi:hypothetical protein
MAKKPSAAEAVSTRSPDGAATGAPALDGAPPEAISAAVVSAVASAVPPAGKSGAIDAPPPPPPSEDLVHARVLDRLVHDGVTYPEGGIVTLTAAQHVELVKAGVVSNEPAGALPY